MAHYAFLNENNIVTEVIVGRNENEVVEGISDWEAHYGEVRGQTCKRTSYNTINGVHTKGGTPYRKNYAFVGFTFDGIGFSAPQPFPSWIKDEETYTWQAPVAMPTDDKSYYWDEKTTSWVEVIN
jgi:hypothetical protein